MRRGQVPTFTQIGGGVALEGCGRNASVTLQKIKLQSVSRQSRRADTNWVTDLGQDQIIFSSPPPTNEPLIGWREWRQIFYIFVTTLHVHVDSVEFSSSMVFSPRGDMVLTPHVPGNRGGRWWLRSASPLPRVHWPGLGLRKCEERQREGGLDSNKETQRKRAKEGTRY